MKTIVALRAPDAKTFRYYLAPRAFERNPRGGTVRRRPWAARFESGQEARAQGLAFEKQNPGWLHRLDRVAS